MLKIITVGQNSYIGEISELEDGKCVVLSQACKFLGNKMNEVLLDWFRKSNTDSLETITLKGVVSYAIKELNKDETEIYNTLESRFERCKSVCLGRLINSTYTDLYKGE
jgi:hypothetical protein